MMTEEEKPQAAQPTPADIISAYFYMPDHPYAEFPREAQQALACRERELREAQKQIRILERRLREPRG